MKNQRIKPKYMKDNIPMKMKKERKKGKIYAN